MNYQRIASLLGCFRLLIGGVLISLFLFACASPALAPPVVDEFELPTLKGRFADEGVASPLVADEAYVDMENYFIRYRSKDGVVYAGGKWSDRMDISVVEAQTDGNFAGPYIMPFDYQQRDRWNAIPDTPIIPPILSSKQWTNFLGSLFSSILPEEEKIGVVMHFVSDDYFMYLNERGDIEVRLFIDKPPDYRAALSISFGDFIKQSMPHLKTFLKAEGIDATRIVFNTGDAGPYSLPFIYIDTVFPIAILVRYPPPLPDNATSSEGNVAVQAGAHITRSTMSSIINRPFSSIFRLLIYVKDAVVETIKPTWMVTLDSIPIPEINDGPGMDLEEWEMRLDRLTRRESDRGTIDFLIDGEAYFTRLIDRFSAAKTSIDIRTYIFDNDDQAQLIGNMLRRRSEEGIKVRILLDGLGTILATGAGGENIPVDYATPQSMREFLESGSEINVRQATNPWFAGDHVKTTIIDNKIAFTGGMNVGREYRYEWHDLMMELQGPVVDVINHEFGDAWAHAGVMGDFGYFFHKLKANHHYADDVGVPLRVLFTRPGNAELFRVQREAIRNAKKYIYIQNAYLTDDAMMYELARARKRGVDVRVILPLAGNHGPINQSNALAANAMMEQGIRVFVYPGMSHIKAAIFDDWICLGTANWDKLSFRVNKELDIATSDPESVQRLKRELFEVDFAKSVELTEPFPERWSDFLYEVLADYAL